MASAGRLLLAACLALASAVASAQSARPLAEDPELEQRMMRIADELRCLVCQNETIAASHADLAVDLREQIREQLRAGRSADEVRSFMVERYGDFVLYTPPFKPTTWLLWGGPFALLAAVVAGLLVRARRGRVEPDAAPLSSEDRARARALLGEDDGAGAR